MPVRVAHAVSSAFGLLGHAVGRAMLTDRQAGAPSRYFLVQHLGAPDMVSSLYREATGGSAQVPDYVYQPASGCFTQEANPHFPHVSFDPDEVLDSTFYSRNPATSPRMNDLIRSHSGGGIVVSMAECLQRYGQVRAMLHHAGCGSTPLINF